MHRLLQFLVWTRGWRMSFHEQLQEKHLCLETMQGFYINTLNGWFLQRFRHRYGLHYCSFWHNLFNVLTIVKDQMDRWSIVLACVLPCTLTHMSTVYFRDIAWIASRQRLKRGYIFVNCDLLGAHACTDVCIVFAQKIMSWYEVGGVMIGSIKRLNKLCNIRVGQDRR